MPALQSRSFGASLARESAITTSSTTPTSSCAPSPFTMFGTRSSLATTSETTTLAHCPTPSRKRRNGRPSSPRKTMKKTMARRTPAVRRLPPTAKRSQQPTQKTKSDHYHVNLGLFKIPKRCNFLAFSSQLSKLIALSLFFSCFLKVVFESFLPHCSLA